MCALLLYAEHMRACLFSRNDVWRHNDADNGDEDEANDADDDGATTNDADVFNANDNDSDGGYDGRLFAQNAFRHSKAKRNPSEPRALTQSSAVGHFNPASLQSVCVSVHKICLHVWLDMVHGLGNDYARTFPATNILQHTLFKRKRNSTRKPHCTSLEEHSSVPVVPARHHNAPKCQLKAQAQSIESGL